MIDNTDDMLERIRAADVGDTIRLRVGKELINAAVRDRVSPVFDPSDGTADRPVFAGFTKDAAGLWDLESLTSARNGVIVEVVVRRAASDM